MPKREELNTLGLLDRLRRTPSAEPRPGDAAQVHFARATDLLRWNRNREALAALQRSAASGMHAPSLSLNTAWARYQLGRFAEALHDATEAVQQDPQSAQAHFALATMLEAQERLEDAERHFAQALELDPDLPEGWLWLGSCKLRRGNAVGAEACARQAMAGDGGSGRSWLNLGMALTSQGRHAEGLDATTRAAAMERETGVDVGATAQLGALLYSQGRIAAAIEVLTGSLPQCPDVVGSSPLSLALLTAGNYQAGWQQYEFRWFQEPLRAVRAKYPRPVWNGQPLSGKTILLRAEQGYGDILQFARYATPLKGMGARVLMQVHPGFEALAASFADVDRVFAQGEEFTAFDFYCNMMSLPGAFGTELATIPARVPYLGVDLRQRERWRARLPAASGVRVGIAWAGNPKHLRDLERSIPLQLMALLFGVDGIRVVSLQKDLRPGDRELLSTFSNVTDLGSTFGNFVDTAAVIDQLDLVICVDTAIAHLAGALGKPVWLLLTEHADFRWLQDRDDSPWYPTMRLFRQAHAGEWAPVVARVAAELKNAAATGSFAVPPPASAGFPAPRRDAQDRSAADVDAARLPRVTEMRDGILQYLPESDDIAKSVGFYGEYAFAHLELLARVMTRDAHVVEVGSGIGAHALWLAHALAPEGHLFVFEDRPMLRRMLRQNLEANDLLHQVTMMTGGLAGKGAAGSAPGHENAQAPGTRLQTIDDLMLERLDLIKIAGHVAARDMVAGAEGTLWRLRPAIFIALPDERALRSQFDQLAAFGYRCWRVETPLFNPGNFNVRSEDIFGGRTALAMLALPEESGWVSALADLVEIGAE